MFLLSVLFQVEAKKAEQQQPRGMGQGGNMGMGGAQMSAGYGRGQYGYPQQPGQFNWKIACFALWKLTRDVVGLKDGNLK